MMPHGDLANAILFVFDLNHIWILMRDPMEVQLGRIWVLWMGTALLASKIKGWNSAILISNKSYKEQVE